MKIIGINAWHADASAALITDGKLILAIEEERFTRKKHRAGFPSQAIRFCIEEAGLKPEDIDVFVIGRDPSAKIRRKMGYLIRNPGGSIRAVRDRLSNSLKVGNIVDQLAEATGASPSLLKGRIAHVEHHRSHIASAFYASPFEEAACLTVDGSGDFTTTMTAWAKNNKIEVVDSVDFPHSIGIFYTAFTQLLGFPNYGDEYKVMGLAPYGKPVFVPEVEKIIRRTNDGLFRLDLSYFRKGTEGFIRYNEEYTPEVSPLYNTKMEDIFGKARTKGEELSRKHKDIAASVQQVTEQLLFYMMQQLYEKTHCPNLCLAGGVAQNSVANGKILENTPFKKVYIPGAAHDAGISMGAAYYVFFDKNPTAKRSAVFNAYLGSRYSNDEIREYLKSRNLDFYEMRDLELFERICDTLVNGGIVGWFNGRSEFGPRALGGRSILADPRRADAKEILNLKIKRRESFRPFAPSVLKEYVPAFFEREEDVPFMEKVFKIKEDKRPLIPAVTHVDGTGRLQTVDREYSPRYYDLIETFRKKTGIPILLNTSFNENEPIVNSIEDAVNCYLRTGMDMLVMEQIVLERREPDDTRGIIV